MLDPDIKNSVNFDAIHRIISAQSKQATGNEAEPSYTREKQPTEEVMKLLELEDDLSRTDCFASLPARRKREGRKPFKIDLSSIGSTLDCTVTEDGSTMKDGVHKFYNFLQDIDVFSTAANHQRKLPQKVSEQNSSSLSPREDNLSNLPIQGSGRKISGNASSAKFSPNDKNTLSCDGENLEEEELTVDISTSYLDHVMESVTQMMKSEIKFDVWKEELLQTSKEVLPKVLMLEESEHDIKLGNQVLQSEKGPQLDSRQQNSDVMPSDVSHSLQLEHAGTHMIISDDHPSTNAIKGKGANRKPDQFQQKATQSQFPLLSVSPLSNISAAVMLLRKRKSKSHSTAFDSYDPCNASIQQEAPETCSPSISLSQEASEASQNFKQAEYAGQISLNISSSSKSPMHEEINEKEDINNSPEVHFSNSLFHIKQQAIDNEPNATRQNEMNSSMSANWPLKKNKSALSRHQKGRMKEKLNWQDWHYLEGAGTSWTSGLRRSTRIRSRPLEFWRGERFLYGRIYSCMATVIGIKYSSPKPSMMRKDRLGTFKVQSFVGKKYSRIVKFAAL